MYGGGNTFEPMKATGLEMEDQEQLAKFEARIERGEK